MTTINDKQFVTNLEREVIINIINSEYMDASGEQIIDWSVWSFSATNGKKNLAGALGSLVRKGLCFSQDDEKEPVCGLTSEGYYWAKNNGLLL